MLKNKFRCVGSTVAFLVLVLFVFSSISLAQEKQEVDLEKKYADIIGNWELDLSDLGMGIMVVEFYVESGSVWALPEGEAEPGEMIPVDGEEWKFEIDDGSGAVWELEFVKNDEDKYHKCKCVNEMAGVDATATKIVDGK
ncbi:MAG: hypothetical protein GY863_25060 [bacterium]|nr:hypothetical protein [bacterium]